MDSDYPSWEPVGKARINLFKYQGVSETLVDGTTSGMQMTTWSSRPMTTMIQSSLEESLGSIFLMTCRQVNKMGDCNNLLAIRLSNRGDGIDRDRHRLYSKGGGNMRSGPLLACSSDDGYLVALMVLKP